MTDQTRYESHKWNATDEGGECVACGVTWQDCEGGCPDIDPPESVLRGRDDTQLDVEDFE